MQIAIFHNILWSKYKGRVFSELHKLTQGTDTKVRFTQIAETEGDRVSLSGVDLSYHTYPFELIFNGSYSSVPRLQRVKALALRAWQAKEDIVIIPGYDQLEYWAMLAVLVVRRKPRAVFCDSTAYDRPHTPLKALAKRAFFSLCTGFFCYGARSKEFLVQHGANPNRVFQRYQAAALPHGYSEQFAIERRTHNAPAPGASPRFVYVGRLSPEKGLDTLIQAMKKVVYRHPYAELHIIGGGPLKEQLATWVEVAQLQPNVKLRGSMGIEALEDEYSRSTALVLPSTSEPWGLVVNEALSFGCPVIVSHACGCVPEMVVAGVTGYEFETSNSDALAERMLRMAEQDTNAADSAQACVEYVQKFSPQHTAEQIKIGCEQILKL